MGFFTQPKHSCGNRLSTTYYGAWDRRLKTADDQGRLWYCHECHKLVVLKKGTREFVKEWKLE